MCDHPTEFFFCIYTMDYLVYLVHKNTYTHNTQVLEDIENDLNVLWIVSRLNF